MNNKYISKYSKYDTHFNRRDQWKHLEWADDEPNVPLWLKELAALGLVAGLILLAFI